MEHCDDKGVGLCDEQGPWSIEITSIMEHFDDRGDGTLG